MSAGMWYAQVNSQAAAVAAAAASWVVIQDRPARHLAPA